MLHLREFLPPCEYFVCFYSDSYQHENDPKKRRTTYELTSVNIAKREKRHYSSDKSAEEKSISKIVCTLYTRSKVV